MRSRDTDTLDLLVRKLLSPVVRFLEKIMSIAWLRAPTAEAVDAILMEILLEKLTRTEPTALERAEFLAELKRLFQGAHPDAKSGGNRATEQVSTLRTWYADVAMRSQRGLHPIRRASAIGARLSPAAAELMRGTEFEDNQRELEALSKLEPATQKKVAAILTDSKNPAPSVAFARKIIEGHTAPNLSLEEKQFQILVKAWERTNQKARTLFKQHIEDHG